MVLDDARVQAILKESRAVPHFILKSRMHHKSLSALITGHDFHDELSKIEHIEKSEEKWQARKKYARSTVDLNERLLRLLDNVYSATGGSKQYDINSESKKKALLNNISHVNGTESLQTWLENNWMPVYHYDPAGVIFLEIPKEGSDSNHAYPTYKSINYIRNYEFNGQYLEWILFEQTKERDVNNNIITLQRIVDSKLDRTFKVDGDNFTLIDEMTYDVPFGACPGIINSNLTKVGMNHMRLSPIENVIELEREYLRDQSILSIVKFLNGFKNLVRPKILCPRCHGIGKTGKDSCKDCSSTGFLINKDVTDEIILPIDITNPDAKIPNAKELANWIGLDTETWDQYRIELNISEVLINETIWGSHRLKDTDSGGKETATGRYIDVQQPINRLNKYSEIAEKIEWKLTEWIANYQDPTKDKSVSIASINYGKRFIIDTPDILLKIYKESKKELLSNVVLDRQLNEYITAKYKSDLPMLRTQLIKIKLDLYIHLDVEMVLKIYGEEQAQKKGLFGDWWNTIDEKDLAKPFEKLKIDRDKWITDEVLRLEL